MSERVENVTYHFVPIRVYPQGVGHKVREHFAPVYAFVQKRRETSSGNIGNNAIPLVSRRDDSHGSIEQQGTSLFDS
jgi:hypothetical protein